MHYDAAPSTSVNKPAYLRNQRRLLLARLELIASAKAYISKAYISYLVIQESLADAKVSARQQCVYEGLKRRNLQQINDMRFPISVSYLPFSPTGF